MKLYKLKPIGYVYLFLGLLVNYGYIMVDQLFVPEKLRPLALFLFALLSFLIFFIIIKPAKPYDLSRLISLITGVIVAIMIVILHIIITFDISYKALIVLGVTIITPFIAGFIYKLLK
ncbi:MAG: hypothetical protein JXB17_09300 [Bacteroidales bacterium]|nr:hypothetical protein [Bacteroidales bacterium]